MKKQIVKIFSGGFLIALTFLFLACGESSSSTEEEEDTNNFPQAEIEN